jgi:hypothetical protein
MKTSFVKSIAFFNVFFLRWIDKNDSFASFNDIHSSSLTDCTFQSKSDFLGSFSFFMENRLSLTSKTSLFHIVSSSTLIKSSNLDCNYFLYPSCIEPLCVKCVSCIFSNGSFFTWEYSPNIFQYTIESYK